MNINLDIEMRVFLQFKCAPEFRSKTRIKRCCGFAGLCVLGYAIMRVIMMGVVALCRRS
jgi:hypothetical protein